MTVVNQFVDVQYTPEQMFALVDKVEDYPKFVPKCSSCMVLHRDENEVKATLTFAHSAIQKSFTTCNRLQKNKMIEIRLIDGPFKQLEGFWTFEPTETSGCRIQLNLEFEFSTPWFGLAFGPIFKQVANSLVEAFRRRANEVYGG